MKNHYKILSLATGLAFTTFTGVLQAQVQVQSQAPQIVMVSSTALASGTPFSVSPSITTTPYQAPLIIDTKLILKLLAIAEKAEGNYRAATFPAGSILVFNPGSGDLEVWDKKNNLLVDVSDIMYYMAGDFAGANFGSNVTSGRQNDTSGLANSSIKSQEIFTITYDDTYAGGSLQFYLSGLMTSKVTDTNPGSTTGLYVETQSNLVPAAVGDGNYQGTPILVTGSFGATVSGTFTATQ